VVRPGAGVDLSINSAVAGLGVVAFFEDGLRAAFDEGALVPVPEPWWQSFSGPFLYFPSRRLMPPPLRAFVDFIKNDRLPSFDQ
jgi:DNA-binding transcriptional LysR family regulator